MFLFSPNDDCCGTPNDDPCFVEWLIEPTVANGGEVLTAQAVNEGEPTTDYGIVTQIYPVDALPTELDAFELNKGILTQLPIEQPKSWTFDGLADHIATLSAALPAGTLRDELDAIEADFRAADYSAFDVQRTDAINRFSPTRGNIVGAVYLYSILARVVPSHRLTTLIPKRIEIDASTATVAAKWSEMNTLAAAIAAATEATEALRDDGLAMLAAFTAAGDALTELDSDITDYETIGSAIVSTLIDWEGLIVDDGVSKVIGGEATIAGGFGASTQDWETRIAHNDYPTPAESAAAIPELHINHVWLTREREEPNGAYYYPGGYYGKIWEVLTKGVQLSRLAGFMSYEELASSWSSHSYEDAPVPAELPRITITLPVDDLEYDVRSYRINCPEAPWHECALTHHRHRCASLIVESILDDTFTYDTPENGRCIGMDALEGTKAGVIYLSEGPSEYLGGGTWPALGSAPMDEHYWWDWMTGARIGAAAFSGTFTIYPPERTGLSPIDRFASHFAPVVPQCGDFDDPSKDDLQDFIAGVDVHATDVTAVDEFKAGIELPDFGYMQSVPLVICGTDEKPVGWFRSRALAAVDHIDSEHGAWNVSGEMTLTWETDVVPPL